ncbi:MAG: response regulator [Chlamydiales bacterium]
MLSFFSKQWKVFKDFWNFSPKRKMALKRRFMCVDGDLDFCEYLESLSTPLGIELDQACSIESAKQKIDEGIPYAAFIIDSHLPDGSGFELAAWIREKRGLDTPIGFLSRVYQDAASFRILKESLKVNYVLEKPINPDEVVQLLTQLCRLEKEETLEEHFPEEILAEVQANYKKSILDKIEHLERLIGSVQMSPSVENLQTLRSEIHKLAGSSGSYGYAKVSCLCKRLELELIQQIELAKHSKQDAEWLLSLNGFFTELKFDFQITLPEEKIPEPFSGSPLTPIPSFYLVDDISGFPEPFLLEVREKWEMLIEENPQAALQKLSSSEFNPQIILVKAAYSAFSDLNGYLLIEAMQKGRENLLTVYGFLIDPSDYVEQSKAIKRGIPFVLIKPATVQAFDFLLDQSLSKGAGYKILVVDDDIDSARYIDQSLRNLGMEVRILSDSLLLQETLMDYQPDVLMVDINLSDEKKTDILHLLKKISYKKQVVALVTISQEFSLIKRVYGSEVDDILFKPLESTILQKRILSLLKNRAVQVEKSQRDPLTGLLNASAFQEHVHKHHLSTMAETPLDAYVVFEIDHYHQLLETMGEQAFEKVISKIGHAFIHLLRIEEYAGYLGKGRFILFFSGYHFGYLIMVMHAFLEEVQREIKEASLSFNCGIASLRHCGQIFEKFEKAFQRTRSRSIELLILDEVDSKAGQAQARIFDSGFQDLPQLEQLFKEQGYVVSVGNQIDEAPVKELAFEAAILLIFAGPLAGVQGGELLRKLAMEKNIRMPVVYMPLFSENALSALLKDGLHYTKNPFNMMILIQA